MSMVSAVHYVVAFGGTVALIVALGWWAYAATVVGARRPLRLFLDFLLARRVHAKPWSRSALPRFAALAGRTARAHRTAVGEPRARVAPLRSLAASQGLAQSPLAAATAAA